MDTWVIVALAAIAILVIALWVMARRRGNAKRRGRADASRERIAAEKHRARAEVSEELIREQAEHDRTKAELHELRAREVDPDR